MDEEFENLAQHAMALCERTELWQLALLTAHVAAFEIGHERIEELLSLYANLSGDELRKEIEEKYA